VVRVIGAVPEPNPDWTGNAPDPGTSYAPYRIFNIGNNNPVDLTQFIEAIEKALGKKAEKQFLDMQPGDVAETYANIDDLYAAVGFKPETTIEQGISRFIEWYRDYYVCKK
jgi:UDP-glucuronate 4-epimerase